MASLTSRQTNARPGFRVFKLAESNFTTWDAQVTHDPKALEQQLELHVDHIREGPDGRRHPLRTTAEERLSADNAGREADAGRQDRLQRRRRRMLICLERELTLELIRAIAEQKPERVVCLDEGFAGNDQLKANAVQTFKTKGVTKFQTV